MATLKVNITNDNLAALNLMAQRHGITPEKELERCANFGIENLFYRMGYNQRKNQETKQLRSKVQMLEAKLAQLLGSADDTPDIEDVEADVEQQ